MKKQINKIKNLVSITEEKGADYYLLSTSDEFLNEYVPEHNMRLKWLTNFSGSNGVALISKKKNFFFTDGRYILQAQKELKKNFEILDLSKINVVNFIKNNLKKKKLLVDTRTFSKTFILDLISVSKKSEVTIIHDNKNSIDLIWRDRPASQNKPIFFLDKKFSGCSSLEKIKKIKKIISSRTLIITSPESVCWLLNIRGYDLPNTPLVLSRLIINNKNIIFYVDLKKVPYNFKLKKKMIVKDINLFDKDISKFSNEEVFVEREIPYFFFKTLSKKNRVKVVNDICNELKSVKNIIEINNSRKAHLYDGIALVKFFYWLEKNLDKNISEFEASKKLELFRKENKGFFSLSFPTISATGANGSIIHYNPKSKSKILKKSQLYLCDSGAQYMAATTDITRTIYLGDTHAPQKIKDIYTLVLLGHLNLSILKFPKGTKGFQIDSIARFELWKRGFDYNHGTGHGVGSFLGVHEGPQSISKSPINVALKPGMIISNEPGFYENKKYGIRIENLVLVKKSSLKNFYDFETLSLFPYEKDLINKNLLNVDQLNWINNYHQLVFKKLSPYLDNEHKTWLLSKTKKIFMNK